MAQTETAVQEAPRLSTDSALLAIAEAKDDRPWTDSVAALVNLWNLKGQEIEEAAKVRAQCEREIDAIMAEQEAEERVFGDWQVSRREKMQRQLVVHVGKDRLYEAVAALDVPAKVRDKFMRLEEVPAQTKYHGPYLPGWDGLQRMGGAAAENLREMVELKEEPHRPLVIDLTDEAADRIAKEEKLTQNESEAERI